MSIDLAAAREIFEGATDFTIGLEEEFALLDPVTHDLVNRYEELSAATRADPVLADSVAGELIASEIEIRSGPGADLRDAISRQRERRRHLFALASSHGLALGATGTHPWADYRDQRIIDTPHYQRLQDDLGYVAWRNNTWSMHVHVGVRGADRAVAVCDRLRPVLPLLLAVSANSPYLEGRDSRLHSARTQIFTRTFPRCGIPDAFGSWKTFADYVAFLERTGSIVEYTQVWWSIRPHISFGTVELRICDAQATAQESEALAALLLACVAQTARDVDEGVPFVDPGAMLIEENLWRAIRYGLDGDLIDLERGEVYPAAAACERLAQWVEPMRAELGLDVALPELNGAQRQRRLIDSGAGIEEVYAGMVRETHESYAQEVIA